MNLASPNYLTRNPKTVAERAAEHHHATAAGNRAAAKAIEELTQAVNQLKVSQGLDSQTSSKPHRPTKEI